MCISPLRCLGKLVLGLFFQEFEFWKIEVLGQVG